MTITPPLPEEPSLPADWFDQTPALPSVADTIPEPFEQPTDEAPTLPTWEEPTETPESFPPEDFDSAPCETPSLPPVEEEEAFPPPIATLETIREGEVEPPLTLPCAKPLVLSAEQLQTLSKEPFLEKHLLDLFKEMVPLGEGEPKSFLTFETFFVCLRSQRDSHLEIDLISRTGSESDYCRTLTFQGTQVDLCRQQGYLWALVDNNLIAIRQEGMEWLVESTLPLSTEEGGAGNHHRASTHDKKGVPLQTAPHLCAVGDNLWIIEGLEGGVTGFRMVPQEEELLLTRQKIVPSQKIRSKPIAIPAGTGFLTAEGDLVVIDPTSGRVSEKVPLSDVALDIPGLLPLLVSEDRIIYLATLSTGQTGLKAFAWEQQKVVLESESLNGHFHHIDELADGILVTTDLDLVYIEKADLSTRWSYPIEGFTVHAVDSIQTEVAILTRSSAGDRIVMLGRNSGIELWDLAPEEHQLLTITGFTFQPNWILALGQDRTGKSVLKLY
jgi:hypothetical protein